MTSHPTGQKWWWMNWKIMKDILMAHFEGLLHQLLEGTEEICETIIGNCKSLGLKIGIWGLKVHGRNGNHHAATCSTYLLPSQIQ
jgi:hypothetical protein